MKNFAKYTLVVSILAMIFSACHRVEMPIVQTNSATSVTETSAILNGEIINDGNGTISQVGFTFGTTSDLSNAQSVNASVSSSTFSVRIDALVENSIYYYRAFATNESGTSYGRIKQFNACSWTGTSGNGQGDSPGNGNTPTSGNGSLNGHDYVDLGLTSGTLWATCNIGAEEPEEYGYYFAWGETAPKESYNLSNYRYYYSDGNYSGYTKYCSRYADGYPEFFTDNLNILEASDDAATVNWGSGWKMPTSGQLEELSSLQHVRTTRNGVNGMLYKGKNNDNTLFIPFAGYNSYGSTTDTNSQFHLWSNKGGSMCIYDTYGSGCCNTSCAVTYSGGNAEIFSYSRCYGLSVRPVINTGGSTDIFPPTVVAELASTVGDVCATLNGKVIGNSAQSLTSCGFIYGTSAENLTNNVITSCSNNVFSYTITGLSSGITYYYKAYAANISGINYSELKSFETDYVTGYVNGHAYVDLGLSSGTLWSTCNVGTNSSTCNGDYYAWGETSTKETYGWDNYIYCNGSENTLIKYCNNSSFGYNGYTDNNSTLQASDDIATINWGSSWRMPTYEEMKELDYECSMEFTTRNGVRGRLYTGRNGNYIFLPLAGWYGENIMYANYIGYYWTSSLHDENPNSSWLLRINNYEEYLCAYRYAGCSVRPVSSSRK